MNSEDLIPGMKFAIKHNLTKRELEVLVPFLEKPYTTLELSEKLETTKATLHGLIKRLKLRNLLVLKDRDAKGNNLYEFNLVPSEELIF